jgi:hypothetical protein
MIFVLRMGLEDQVSHWKSQGAFKWHNALNPSAKLENVAA